MSRMTSHLTKFMLRVACILTMAIPNFFFFFFKDTAPTEISTLPLHDALPISYSRSARVVEALRMPRHFNARLRLRHVRARLSRVDQRSHRDGTQIKVLFAGNFRQPQRISGRATNHGGPEIAHHVKPFERTPSATRNHHRAELPDSFHRRPESDEGTKREGQKHAIAPGYARAPQNEPPALPPPCPALGSVHDAQGNAGSSGSLMHARVSFGRKSQIGRA